MHRKVVVAGTVTAVLALVTFPGLVGSRTPSAIQPVGESAFTTITPASVSSSTYTGTPVLDPIYRSAGSLDSGSMIVESGATDEASTKTTAPIAIPAVAAGSEIRPPLYKITGRASWYDNGTTAMRLPRGTVVRICGAGGCVERTITDYGPAAYFRPARIADLMPSDFRAVCGCSTGTGVTQVTVSVY